MEQEEQLTLERLHKMMLQHFEDDRNAFSTIHLRLDAMATKDDAQQILNAIKTVKLSVGIFKIGWKGITLFATIITTIALLTGAWKVVLGWLLMRQ